MESNSPGPLSQPWIGSPAQRKAYAAKCEREGKKRRRLAPLGKAAARIVWRIRIPDTGAPHDILKAHGFQLADGNWRIWREHESEARWLVTALSAAGIHGFIAKKTEAQGQRPQTYQPSAAMAVPSLDPREYVRELGRAKRHRNKAKAATRAADLKHQSQAQRERESIERARLALARSLGRNQ